MDSAVIVCRCEDVTFGEITECVDEDGIVDLAEAKRRLRLGMGMCQGRTCGLLLKRSLGTAAKGSLDRSFVVRPILLADMAAAQNSDETSAGDGGSGRNRV
ncbi:(2Fe-2S)-binding protein [Brevibacterium casei]|uniref:(2Fe-2S)-binding protein n=2 Tax=Brevibacterium casei TaxID=33889 RepID=A0A449D1X1_9MICO|nr:(2Fe-2S)-binding protein [Brevibacterium casei]QPR39966.1 (2Fe-2S)-binding protein [Brevibacterium casei]QPR44130.1 (2Fe-2S)-binding protein [Brevibacterium casei]QPS32334.1 (2Fe-2S)-binding protein [Brevibacterium casei]SMX90933.1 BFD-like [2Fe-2S] binding domain-containing protein [Brevibacterium casei CIP 102111]VEW11488.1 Anaerobic glycerol-3-phosphate dehydrogenase subunit A [Brevibacterium casei]